MVARVLHRFSLRGRRVVTGLVVCLAALAGCRTAHPVRASVSAPPLVDDRQARMESAAAEVRGGCYDCLRAGLTIYESLISDATYGSNARAGGVRAALLLAVRETELGLVPGGFIERARHLLGPADLASPELPALVEIAEVIASGPTGFTRSATTDKQFAAMVTISRRQEQWASVLLNLMPQDLTATYLWLGLACGPYNSTFPRADEREAVVAPVADVPLIGYKRATACGLTSSEPLEALLAVEPRFGEIHYHLGLFALGGQTGRPPDLDAADARFRPAFEWRPTWPTLTLAMANVAMSAEDFPRALEFYDHTLALSTDDPDALAGTLRALTYENRHQDAIAVADRLIALGRNPGEAHYWKAMNLARLKRDELAWTEIEEAAKGLANADVPKLAGILAINRRELATARQRLELARVRRRTDCETLYYLQTVLAEQRDWDAAVNMSAEAGSCFEKEEASIEEELALVRSSEMAADRRARLVSRREQQLASDARMRATSWFNAAAASFNLARKDEARRYAEKVADDALFGERARTLLERIK